MNNNNQTNKSKVSKESKKATQKEIITIIKDEDTVLKENNETMNIKENSDHSVKDESDVNKIVIEGYRDNHGMQDKKSMSEKVSYQRTMVKGELLEFRIKRLFFFMGYWAHNNIMIQTSQDEPFDVVTDLDVYGIYMHNNFISKTIWADCKSGNANELSRISWLIGIKDLINVDEVLFVKKGVKTTTKVFANKRNIQIVDLEIISEIEKRYNIHSNDWRGSWNPNANISNLEVFRTLKVPDNQRYKRVGKFMSTHYWASDKYGKIKKSITALKELSVYIQFPLKPEETRAIKWASIQIINMFLLAVLNVCRDLYYLNDRDKESIIIEGLTFGEMPKKRMEDILKVTNHLAHNAINGLGLENKVEIPEVKLNAPEYAEAFINFVIRIINSPNNFYDILRFMDFCLFEYDLEDKKYNMEEIKCIFSNHEELITSEKTILHFICYVSKMPIDIFTLLK